MALELEIQTYQEKLPELIQHEGKYALVHGNDLVNIYGTYEDAIKEGYARFQLQPFMVKQIHAIEQVQQITRLL